MNQSDLFVATFYAILPSLLFVIAAVWGAVLCHSRLRRSHAKAGRFATVGFSLMALQVLAVQTVPTYFTVTDALRNRALTEATRTNYPESLASYMSVVGLVSMVLFLASLIVLVFAVLADRTSPTSSRGAI
jgi:hypothetical protein